MLDLACGPGRHAVALARRGFRVTGVDRTRSYLDAARRRAAEQHLELEFIQEDMRQFERPGYFDVVLSLFSSFGYFDEPQEDRRVLAHLYVSARSTLSPAKQGLGGK